MKLVWKRYPSGVLMGVFEETGTLEPGEKLGDFVKDDRGGWKFWLGNNQSRIMSLDFLESVVKALKKLGK